MTKTTIVLGLMIFISIFSSMLPVTITTASESSYEVFISKHYDGVTPLGVFERYVVGYRDTESGTEIVAIDMYNDTVFGLGLAETFGLNIMNTTFRKTDQYFMLTDNKVIIVWDKDIRQVGRFARSNLRGVTILPSNHLVAWSRDIVTVFRGPGFVYGRHYDIWNHIYELLNASDITPSEFLSVSGYDVGEIIEDIMDEIYAVVLENNGTLIEEPKINITYNFTASSPSELRSLIQVDVIASTVVDYDLYVALNVRAPVVIEGRALYTVVEGNNTEIRSYYTARTYYPRIGLLLKVNTIWENRDVAKLFHRVEAGAVASVMAVVYEPTLNESTVPRILLIILEDGEQITVPVYTSSAITEVFLVGEYEFVKTGTGIVNVYRREEFVEAFFARTINDIGMDGEGRVYVVYRNDASALEFGTIDQYSGRFTRYVIETTINAVGAYVSSDLLFFVGKDGWTTRVDIATELPLASVIVRFVDQFGYMVNPILEGVAKITYGDLVIDLRFNTNPLVFRILPGSSINVTVYVPYGKGNFTYFISDAEAYELDATVMLAFTPGMPGESLSNRPFYNPFFREYVVVRDSETLKYQLPGAISIDAYGILLALIRTPRGNSTPGFTHISLYRVDGVELYTLTLPGVLNEVKFYYPYLVAKGYTKLYVIDVLSGVIKGELALAEMSGYDVDTSQSYVVAWSPSKIIVHDIRRQSSVYLEMSEYGRILVAPVVNGVVYAYVVSPDNKTSIYVINPSTKGIIDILPWNGVRILSFVSDGVFHAISYVTSDGEKVTDIISMENGVTKLFDGPVIWVRTLGSHVNIPNRSELRGSVFAAIVVKELNTARVYVTGINTVQIHEITELSSGVIRLSLNYIAELSNTPNATTIIVLRDYSGVPRVSIISSMVSTLLSVSENLIAYGNAEAVYMIPGPRVIGKYHVMLKVYDDRGNPIDATIFLKEFGISTKTERGVFKTYLSMPGTYHVVVKAKYYEETEVEVTVDDSTPVAEVSVYLEPSLFTVSINVTTPDGKVVKTGTVTVRGIDVEFEEMIDLSVQEPIVEVRKGIYSITYTSDVFTKSEATVNVTRDTTVTLITNRTSIKLLVRVMDENGDPVPGAEVIVESKLLASPIEAETNETGVVRIVLPYGIAVNITASHPDYPEASTSINATGEAEEIVVELVLAKPRAIVTIFVQDEEGNPETADVTIRDETGNVIETLYVSQTTTIELSPGAYTFEAKTKDGRTTTVSTIITPDEEFMAVNLVLPKKPAPIYITIFPYLLIIVLVASAIIVIYRKYFRKLKPKKVS